MRLKESALSVALLQKMQLPQVELPAMDQFDLENEIKQHNPLKRQFAPIYSQRAYEAAMDNELAIGNYTKLGSVSDEQRKNMVCLMEEICQIKTYREETFYRAV